ncbi:hypothetical protein [Serratia quinivorans]|uniref:hypothetical protein n=1 Tax=Serratia quinivorans TaxID=137545 RepID=UPI00217993DD|nr:hypothetical protein [Serratia quinivorans]CAI0849023.1 Uncharacterised protein [Serratia quinivorans]
MTTIFFIGDDHEKDGTITAGTLIFSEFGFNPEKDNYILLLESEEDNGDKGFIPKTDYEIELAVILDQKPKGKDSATLRSLMNNSDNNVYGFDNNKPTFSVARQNQQRKSLQKYVTKNKDTKGALYYVIVVGAAHLEPRTDVKGWVVLQNNEGDFYGSNCQIAVNIPD